MEEGVIALDPFAHQQIEGRVLKWEEMTDEEMAADLEFILSIDAGDRNRNGLAPLTAEEFIAQYCEPFFAEL